MLSLKGLLTSESCLVINACYSAGAAGGDSIPQRPQWILYRP
jgi:hypothetical protein